MEFCTYVTVQTSKPQVTSLLPIFSPHSFTMITFREGRSGGGRKQERKRSGKWEQKKGFQEGKESGWQAKRDDTKHRRGYEWRESDGEEKIQRIRTGNKTEIKNSRLSLRGEVVEQSKRRKITNNGKKQHGEVKRIKSMRWESRQKDKEKWRRRRRRQRN